MVAGPRAFLRVPGSLVGSPGAREETSEQVAQDAAPLGVRLWEVCTPCPWTPNLQAVCRLH